ncbi:hypothetical protein [Pseudoalteromonas sp. HM-SA03]|uniref:hypothetical protein n=1 Tax=Pseudoalteromonas sp. HM-SA03 TaxID=2029678 RepID=UPI0020D00B84|nr:hypothetical protein [Pseudoalteromonas sp. HM-SA03]
MMIHKDKCQELGLPEPLSYHNQLTYVLMVISQGLKLSTRNARYIGIHNLHSLVSILRRKGYQFTLEHGRVHCPFTGIVPPYPVDIVSMSYEQIQLYKSKKSRPES